MSVARTRSADKILLDPVRESPVDRSLFKTRRNIILVVLVLIVGIGGYAVWKYTSDRPVTYSSVEEHFKYGSIGSEPGGSVLDPVGGVLPPYWVFKVLPDLFPERLPGGYASLGLIMEDGHDLPIGVSRRHRLGFDQVGLNCAVCHTGTWRATPESKPQIVLGMPAHGLNLQAFFNFVLDSTLDPRFTADNVIGRIEAAGGRLGPLDRYIYRTRLIPLTRATTLNLRSRIAPLLTTTAQQWGSGRVDTFNPYKAIQFNWRLENLPPSELIGASDYPSLWNQKPREGMHLHWDGNNDSVDERNLSASLGTGATPVTLDHASLGRVKSWIWTLPPPVYPFPVDQPLAAQGEKIFHQACASCHADHQFRDGVLTEAGTVGKVVPIAVIGTDSHRLNSYTAEFAENQYTLYPDSEYAFRHFRKTYGYANHPLDGIWLRAPYLHNGSVPTLADLLEAPEARPKVFYRGYDVFDQQKVGFRTDVAEEKGRKYFRFDTALPGNGNGGHSYGTTLPADQKKALLEYMKRL